MGIVYSIFVIIVVFHGLQHWFDPGNELLICDFLQIIGKPNDRDDNVPQAFGSWHTINLGHLDVNLGSDFSAQSASNFLQRKRVVLFSMQKRNFYTLGQKTTFYLEITNTKNFHVWKMWILWKLRLWKCELCEKWNFENVNFV